MIHWPGMLKLDGDDELIYLASEVDFNAECTSLLLTPADVLIDSHGWVYSLVVDGSVIELQPNAQTISAEQASALIQRHEFSLAQMCLTKIQFDTVGAAIMALMPYATIERV